MQRYSIRRQKMTDKTSLGDRMKSFEVAVGNQLIPRMPTIIRVDGKAFHTFTKKINNTNDPSSEFGPSEMFHSVMTSTAMGLCNYIQNATIAYHQSDEISILLRDYDKFETQQWFGGKVQKIVSTSAAMAASYFNHSWQRIFDEDPTLFNELGLFDSRVFQVPKEDVNNYFLWRQQDATRNSINFIGQKHFSHKELQFKSTSDVQEMLWSEFDCNWNDFATWKKRGQCIVKNTDGNYSQSTPWVVDPNIPIFSKDTDYINKLVYLEDD